MLLDAAIPLFRRNYFRRRLNKPSNEPRKFEFCDLIFKLTVEGTSSISKIIRPIDVVKAGSFTLSIKPLMDCNCPIRAASCNFSLVKAANPGKFAVPPTITTPPGNLRER